MSVMTKPRAITLNEIRSAFDGDSVPAKNVALRRAHDALAALARLVDENAALRAEQDRLEDVLDAGDALFAAERAEGEARQQGEDLFAAAMKITRAGGSPDLTSVRESHEQVAIALSLRQQAMDRIHDALAVACASRQTLTHSEEPPHDR